MEILESAAWVTLGFPPMIGSMELAWRLSKKGRSKKATLEAVHKHGML
jgi:hypothetical protein